MSDGFCTIGRTESIALVPPPSPLFFLEKNSSHFVYNLGMIFMNTYSYMLIRTSSLKTDNPILRNLTSTRI